MGRGCCSCRRAPRRGPGRLRELDEAVIGTISGGHQRGEDRRCGWTFRTYRLFVPSSVDPKRPGALIVVLHGGLMTFDRIVEGTGFSELAMRVGFIVVYPKPEPGVFFNSGDRNLATLTNPPRARIDLTVDDAELVRVLIARIGAEYVLDSARIFATGISNGGSMAHRLGCELSDQIAAIAPVAGELMVECHPVRPVSVIEFHGFDDPIFPFAGGVGKFGGTYPAVEATFARWRQLDGCPTRGPCNAGSDVVLHRVPGRHGHGWPPDGAQKIWDFFAAHPRT